MNFPLNLFLDATHTIPNALKVRLCVILIITNVNLINSALLELSASVAAAGKAHICASRQLHYFTARGNRSDSSFAKSAKSKALAGDTKNSPRIFM